MAKNDVAILFTGGKDSTLVACLEASKGRNIHLLTGVSGIGINSELSNIRVRELVERFPGVRITRHFISTSALLRKISIKDIEQDILRWKCNLVLLGDKMAIHAAATAYCLENNIKIMLDGVVKYQDDLVEQKLIAMKRLREFEQEYGIEYDSPIYNFGTRKDVKYALMEFGISNKSLEGVSIFGDSFSEPSDKVINEYIDEKIHYCHEHIQLLSGNIGKESGTIKKSSALIIKDSRLLAVRKKNNLTHFILPGGKLEREEDPEEALKRELFEELNLQTEQEQYHYIGDFLCKSQFENNNLLTHLYFVEINELPLEIEVNNEILDYEWIDLSDSKREDLASGIKEFGLVEARRIAEVKYG